MARKNVIQFSVEVVDKVSKKLGAIAGKITQFARRAAAAAAGLAIAFTLAAKAAVAAADQIGKTAKVIGISAESLQELRFAAGQAGVSMIGLDDSLRRMQRRMGEFINSGAGPAQKALEGLGITITDTKGRFIGTEAAFNNVVEGLSQLGTVAERSAVLAQLFGDDFGPKLVPLLDMGAEGIAKLRKEFRDLGGVISNESIAAAESANDAFTRLTTLIQSKMIKAFADNAEAIESVADALLTVTLKALDAAEALAIFFGIGEANKLKLAIREINEELAFREKNPGRAKFFSFKETGSDELRDILAINEARLAGLQNLKSLAAFQARTRESLVAGGAGGFSSVDTSLDSFIASFDTLEMKAAKMTAKLNKAIAAGLIPSEAEQKRIAAEIQNFLFPEIEVTSKKKNISEMYDPMVAAAEQAAGNIQDAFAEFFFDPFENGIKGMLASFVDAIRKMIANVVALKVVESFGISGGLKSILGLSSGGPVNGGQPYIVGERGPELFIPGASGRISPNSALSSAGGGLQFVTNISANGADPGLIARLPAIMEQRDRQLMLKVKQYLETGSIAI